jgi:hypothetical protein
MGENNKSNNGIKSELSTRKCGGLWVKEKGATGNKFLSAEITLKGKTIKFIGLKRRPFPDEQPNNNRPQYELFLTQESANEFLEQTKIKESEIDI